MADKEKKVKLISGIPLFIADKGLDFIQNRVKLALPDDSVQERGAMIFFETADEILVVISDDNPANTEQVRDVIFGAIHNKVRPFLAGLLQPVIDDIDRDDDRAVANFGKDKVYQLVGLFTDNEADNKAQIKSLFEEIRKSDETKDVVLNKLLLSRLREKWAGNPSKELTLAFIEESLNALWTLVQGNDDDGALNALEKAVKSITE